MKKLLLIFFIGLVEQLMYTFYILAVARYMIIASSVLMFSYMIVYLVIIDRIAKDKNDSLKMVIVYALACGLGNFIALILHLIK